jgi:hypothetical protein
MSTAFAYTYNRTNSVVFLTDNMRNALRDVIRVTPAARPYRLSRVQKHLSGFMSQLLMYMVRCEQKKADTLPVTIERPSPMSTEPVATQTLFRRKSRPLPRC